MRENRVRSSRLVPSAAPLLVMLLLFLVACSWGDGHHDGSTPPPAPRILSLTAANSPIPAGTSTTLTAFFVDGTGSVDQGVGPITSGVPVSTGSLLVTTSFRLTVTGPGGTVTRDITVSTLPAALQPVLTAPTAVTAGKALLAASVPDQAGCTFAWTITGGTFTGGAATATCSAVTFTAGAAGTLVLGCTATNALGDAGALGTLSVSVLAAPIITAFSAEPITIALGDSSILTCHFTGGAGLITPGDHAMLDGGTWAVLPVSNTEYTLHVTNAVGDGVTSRVTVNVSAGTASLGVTISRYAGRPGGRGYPHRAQWILAATYGHPDSHRAGSGHLHPQRRRGGRSQSVWLGSG